MCSSLGVRDQIPYLYEIDKIIVLCLIVVRLLGGTREDVLRCFILFF
jgi:hypothetical protein